MQKLKESNTAKITSIIDRYLCQDLTLVMMNVAIYTENLDLKEHCSIVLSELIPQNASIISLNSLIYIRDAFLNTYTERCHAICIAIDEYNDGMKTLGMSGDLTADQLRTFCLRLKALGN